MKKLLKLFIMATMIVGCQSEQKIEVKPIQMNQVYQQDGIHFEVSSITIEPQILPANTNSEYHYIDRDSTNEQLLDIILKVDNQTDRDLDNTFVDATLVIGDSIETGAKQYAVDKYIESADYTSVSSSNMISKGQSGLLHFACNIKDELKKQKALLTLTIQDQLYNLEFVVEDYLSSRQSFALEKTLEKENLFSMKFTEVLLWGEVLPDNIDGEYEYYYLNDKENNFFIYVTCDFENKSDHDMSYQDIPSFSLLEETRFPFSVVKQTEDAKGFYDSEDLVVKQGEKCRLFYFKEMNKKTLKSFFASHKNLDITYLNEKYALEVPYDKIDVD